jgi:hypothetical protein
MDSILRWPVRAALGPLIAAGFLAGCSPTDNTKVIDAPVPPKTDESAVVSKNRGPKHITEENPKYDSKLERRFGKGGG